MSIKANFPDIKPSLMLDFANTKRLDPRITFTRATTATYYDGYTVAKAEENLFIRSQEFNNAAWSKIRCSATADSIAAPDGTTTAETITQTAGQTNAGIVRQSTGTTINGLVYTVSVFAKAGTGRNFLFMEDVFTSTGVRRTWFDIDNGTVGTTNAEHTASIESVGDDWYRCIITVTRGATSSEFLSFAPAETDGSTTVTDNQGFIYLWGAQLEQRSSVTAYTPTTTQPITNYIPVLQSAASGEARFDHDPVTGESKGLLIEEQRTNLLLRSEEFDNAAWQKTSATITADTIVAPNGTLTGDKLVDTTANAYHYINRSISFTAGVTYSRFIYAKAGGVDSFYIDFPTLRFGNCNFNVNLAAGTVNTNPLNGSGTITSVGNDWYRVALTATCTSTGTGLVQVVLGPGGPYVGDGYSGIYIWGAQAEIGAFPTSYIPTVASQVTRNADAASMTGANFSSWYRADEGTLYGSCIQPSASGVNRTLAYLTESVAQLERVELRAINAGTNAPRAYINGSGSNQCDFNFSALTAGSLNNMIIAYKVNDFAGSLNASAAQTDASGLVANPLLLIIGATPSTGVNSLNGTIKKIAYYPARLSNTELQGLTS